MPPPTLDSAVLSTMSSRARRHGVRIFFDSERQCRGGCPCGVYSWASQCGRPGVDDASTIARAYRWVWKPIVVPRAVWDVGTHGFAASGRNGMNNMFTPVPDDTSVFCPCLRHEGRPGRSSPPPFQNGGKLLEEARARQRLRAARRAERRVREPYTGAPAASAG